MFLSGKWSVGITIAAVLVGISLEIHADDVKPSAVLVPKPAVNPVFLQGKVQDFMVGSMSRKVLIDSLEGINLYEEISYDFKSDGKFLAKSQSFYEVNGKQTFIDKSVITKSGSYSISDVAGDKAKLSLVVDGKTVSDTVKLPMLAEKLPAKIEMKNLPINSRSITVGDVELKPMK